MDTFIVKNKRMQETVFELNSLRLYGSIFSVKQFFTFWVYAADDYNQPDKFEGLRNTL
jgi:hypothetical protein